MAPRVSRRKITASEDDDDDEARPEETTQARQKSTVPSKSYANGGKSKPSPQKSKRGSTKKATKDSQSHAEKPIRSFFSAVAPGQQSSQQQSVRASERSVRAIDAEIEAIHDDSSDGTSAKESSSLALSKGSSTALAMRKRKFHHSVSSQQDTEPSPAASQKFRKANSGDKLTSFTSLHNDKQPWTEQFAPKDLSELAVHKRKVTDVRNWLDTTFKGRRQKVLVLKGASGTGKTTTIQLLARELGIQLIEWKDSSTSDYGSDDYVSASGRFEEFVGRAGRLAGLTLATDPAAKIQVPDRSEIESEDPASEHLQALLMEEFPNTFSKTSSTLQSFRSTIAQYVSTPLMSGSALAPTPIIMIISETLLSTTTAAADSFTAHRLLGPELSTNPYINIIEFNAIAPTYLTKALELVVVKEARKSGRRRTPGPQVLKTLAETGDIRSAVSSLEFLCLRGDDDEKTWSSKVAFTKTKQAKTNPPLTPAEQEALKLITNRESSLGIFHSVGKVVYNKREEAPSGKSLPQPPTWLPEHRREKLPETNADLLIDELGTDTSTFLAALHENYALSCSCPRSDASLGCLSNCMNYLSDADLLSLDRFSFGTRAFSGSATDTLRQDELCFQVAVRGLLFSLPNPVHRGAGVAGSQGSAYRMYYPSSLRISRQREEIEDKLEMLIASLGDGSGNGSAASGLPPITGQKGVENWKQNAKFDSGNTSTTKADAEPASHHSSEIRNEMLTDRLPYMAHIMSTAKSPDHSQHMLDQILAVTRISTTVSTDEQDEAEEGGDGSGNEQWTTDKPDTDTGKTSTGSKKPIISRKRKPTFEAASIPVETRVEKLVLEDDDIVDD